MATFYAARSEIITPLPWPTFALPFSMELSLLGIKATATRVMEQAKDFGLCHRGIFVEKNESSDGERCILSASGADREFTDAEMADLK